MLNQLLNLKRPLFCADVETTGLTSEDRIIELGFQCWETTGLTKEWRSFINPLIEIPQQAIAIHGITNEMMLNCQVCGGPRKDTNGNFCTCEHFKVVPTFRQLAPNLAKGFSNCDWAGKNIRFDLRKLSEEFKRAGVEWSYAGARILDADRLEALALPRDLGSLHEKYTGAKHEGAHGALSDVRATATVIVEQLVVHGGKLPRDLDQLHEMQWPGWLVADGSFRMVNGVATCMFGKHRDIPLRAVPWDYLDYILREKFPEDVKALARDAKLGKFPEAV